MLTSFKWISSIFRGGKGLGSGLSNWWFLMSDAEQKQTVLRGISVASCAAVATVALPTLSAKVEVQHESAAFRAKVETLVAQVEQQEPVRVEADLALLDHPWMRSVEYALERDSDDVLSKFGQRSRDLAALEHFASFEPRHFEVAERRQAEHLCLSQAIYYEARSESVMGQVAVAEVVYNRVRDHRYPNTVCEVVFQGSERTTGCQFSFTCDGAMKKTPRGRHWARAQQVASHVVMGLNRPLTGTATHYHTDYVDPVWNKSLIHTKTIGTHIFYRFPEGREWREVRERQERAT